MCSGDSAFRVLGATVCSARLGNIHWKKEVNKKSREELSTVLISSDAMCYSKTNIMEGDDT